MLVVFLSGVVLGWLGAIFYVTFTGGSTKATVSRSLGVCGDEHCSSRQDPRCVAGNCTYHCRSFAGCSGTCITVWMTSDHAEDFARTALQKARTP